MEKEKNEGKSGLNQDGWSWSLNTVKLSEALICDSEVKSQKDYVAVPSVLKNFLKWGNEENVKC